MSTDRINHQWWLLAWVVLSAWLLYLLSPILTPFVVSALLAYLGDPLVDRLEERKVPRALAVSLVFSVIFLVLIVLALILVPRIEAQIAHLINKIPFYLEWLRISLIPRIQDLLPDGEVEFSDMSALQAAISEHWFKAGGIVKSLVASVSQSGMAILAWLANLVLVPVLTFYLLRDWDNLVLGVKALLPQSSVSTWTRLATESDEVLAAFLRGQLLVMFSLGVIYTTGLWLVGLDLALLIGMFAGLVSFVPYLGLIVGILIAGIASFLQFQGLGDLHWVILVFVVGQLVEGMFLTPRLVGERIGLHPVAVIFAVMAGAQLYGFFGVLLALPIAAVVMVLLRHLLETYRRSSFFTET